MLLALAPILACGGRPDANPARRARASGAAAERMQVPHYDCRTDPALNFPVYVPPADSAGLGRAIAAHFPGYRLSTELEIGCRFPLADSARPAQVWPQWDSGNPWWIWRGDFDGDGRPDRLILLSLVSDPSKDLLVVLHGNGSVARVTAPGGWGVAVLDPAQARRAGVPGRRKSAIAIIRWGQGSSIYYWDGSAYVLKP